MRVFDELFRTRARKVLAVVLLLGLIFVVVLTITAHYAEPLLRARVIETLSTRFQSRVELDDLQVSRSHVSMSYGLLVSGKGLRIYGQTDPNIHRAGFQPLIGVDEFHFSAGILNLLKSPIHVGTVYIKGLEINTPPKQDRQMFRNLGPKDGKIRILVDQFQSQKAHLVINTDRPDKLPLDFDIQDLRMQDIGPDRPLSFTAVLVNPKPVGNIGSHGEFGPFHPEDPRESPVRGEYTFSKADLATLKGIGGILSSSGRYQGTLGKIVVDGQTDTPDFRLEPGGRPVPLKTTFHAIVDGTSGDTYLQPVNATILSTLLTATGFVVTSATPPGHHIQLDVTIPSGKIEDLLRLGDRTNPPIMTGTVHLQTKLNLPPGDGDLVQRLYLKGRFEVTGARFSNENIQSRVDELSLRGQGKPKLATDGIPDNIKSRLAGDFVLKSSVLALPNLVFQLPGAKVTLAGNYRLDGEQFDFRGHALFDAKLSKMVRGWKSVFLKPVDPFFRKNGAGADLPVKITGTKSETHFGLDLFDEKNKPVKETRVQREK
jgi:hypothetical protein